MPQWVIYIKTVKAFTSEKWNIISRKQYIDITLYDITYGLSLMYMYMKYGIVSNTVKYYISHYVF